MARLRGGFWPITLILVFLVFGIGMWAASRAYTGWRAYGAARSDIGRLQSQSTIDPGSVSSTDLAHVQVTFQDLSFDLRRVDQALTTAGVAPVLSHLPWVAPRYHAARQLLDIGELLAASGDSGAGIAQETLSAYQQTGVMANSSTSSQTTWLDVVASHQSEMERISRQVSEARELRASLDTSMLPANIRARLPELDRWLNRYDVQTFANQDLPAIESALGAGKDARYLVLFQNPEELRPAGGFPGTIALVTLSHGQVKSYDFSDIKVLTADYMSQRPAKLQQPWPIEQYFPQDGFLIQDATWFADFPKSGAQVMSMYAQTNWPPIDGVIAVEPAAVSAVLDVIGPVTVDVDGEQRTITAANVLDEVERQRRLGLDSKPGQLKHKQVLELIGEEIIAHLKQGNRAELSKIEKNLQSSAAHRDIQIYSPDARVESLLDSRRWTGRLTPAPEQPTLGVTFANLVLVKDSMRMKPSIDLKLGPAQNGRREASLTITIKNTGTKAEDPFYAGFQKWWVQVSLPAGSRLESSNPSGMPDPDAPDGGSYKIDVFPQQTGKIVVKFTMDDTASLLLRRQPGVLDPNVTVTRAGCTVPSHLTLTGDTTIPLGMCQ